MVMNLKRELQYYHTRDGNFLLAYHVRHS